MKVALLLGSIRLGRQTHKIAYYLENKLKERGVETTMIDLLHYQLPLMEGQADIHHDLPPVVAVVGELLKEADALLLITPEYHGTFSGVLKNAIDYYRAEISKKPVGVVTATGGKMGGINASTQLQHVILSMGSFPLPLKLLVPDVQHSFDDDYNPLNESVVKTTSKFLDEFLWFAGAIYTAKQSLGKKEFVK
jgi:azobenzene reductase